MFYEGLAGRMFEEKKSHLTVVLFALFIGGIWSNILQAAA